MNSIGSTISQQLDQAGSYTDFTALAKLRAKAANSDNNADTTRAVAKQFESLFLQMMLKAMRDASPAGESGESDQMRFYQDMFDKQVAIDLASREKGGIGLADILTQQLGGIQGKAEAPVNNTPLQVLTSQRVRLQVAGNGQAVSGQRASGTAVSVPATTLQSEKLKTDTFKPETSEDFTRGLWPHAQRAAKQLGVNPEVLIAQSALETGWGQKLMQDKTGRLANNLFGIKADAQWRGERVSVATLEYRDGIAAKEQADFRAYASPADSFDDYVRLVKDSPRYQQALEQPGDTHAYLTRLQQAGYATDPAYAAKIEAITNRQSFINTIEALKNNEQRAETVSKELNNG